MAITTEDIKKLRDMTGVSVMQCKKALEEADGDQEKALAILKKKSADIATKKGDRTLGAGIISSYIHSNKKIGVMIELLCETDFVANNSEFQSLAYDIAMHTAALKPEFVSREVISEDTKTKVRELFEKDVTSLNKPEDIKTKILEGKMNDYFAERTLLDQPFVKNPDTTIGTLITQAVQKFGEKIQIGRFVYYSVI